MTVASNVPIPSSTSYANGPTETKNPLTLAQTLPSKVQSIANSSLNSNLSTSTTSSKKREGSPSKITGAHKKARVSGDFASQDSSSSSTTNSVTTDSTSNTQRNDLLSYVLHQYAQNPYIEQLCIERLLMQCIISETLRIPGVCPLPDEALTSYSNLLLCLNSKLKAANRELEAKLSIALQLELQAAEGKGESDSISPFSKEHPSRLQNAENNNEGDLHGISSPEFSSGASEFSSSSSVENVDDFLLNDPQLST